MFRSLFYVAPVLALDYQYQVLLQRASSELSSGTLRSLEENLAAKDGCEKHIAALPEVKAHDFEAAELVAEWKDKFNYKRKVKKDVKISTWCATQITENTWNDAQFKDSACKTLEKAKKQCSKSLKATCNFVRSTTRSLFKKALKGSRKVRKEAAFTALRDPLKTKVNEFSCKKYKKVKPVDLKATQFGELKDHFTAIYAKIKTLKAQVDTSVAAKDASKTKRTEDLQKAKDAKQICEDAAEQAETAAIAAATTTMDQAINTAKTSTTLTADLKKDAEDAARGVHKTKVKEAKAAEEVADQVCDDLYDAAKAKAEADFKASR